MWSPKTKKSTKLKRKPRQIKQPSPGRGCGSPSPLTLPSFSWCPGLFFLVFALVFLLFLVFLPSGLPIPPSIPQPGVWLLSPSNFSWLFLMPWAICPVFCFSFPAFPGFPGFGAPPPSFHPLAGGVVPQGPPPPIHPLTKVWRPAHMFPLFFLMPCLIFPGFRFTFLAFLGFPGFGAPHPSFHPSAGSAAPAKTRKTRKSKKTKAKTTKNRPGHQEKPGKVRGAEAPHPRLRDGRRGGEP